MANFTFWNLWHRHNKILFIILLVIFIISAAIYIYAAFEGANTAITWDVNGHWEKFGVLINSLDIALFNFDLFADNYVITEAFSAGEIRINPIITYAYLVLLAVAFSVLLAVVSALPRFWYIAGMGLFIFILTNFKLEQLQLFGKTDFTGVIIVLLLYIPASYYIHAIRTDLRFPTRILIFAVITTIVGILVGTFATIAHPWLYLAHFGMVGPIVLSIIFIFLVSHEIIAAFLYLITNFNSTYSKNSLLHFSALSIIYLVNILFAYGRSRGAITWDIIYINAFMLLVVSAIVGIWGFKKRSSLFSNMIPMNGPGEMLYLSLGIICFATIGYLFFNANDPILETFEDAILFTHFGFGFFFFVYILVNFMTLLVENMRVYKVVYKPVRMPFVMANIGGLAIVALFLFRANLYPFSQAVSGYYNGIGDTYVVDGNLFLAEQYYRLGSGYGYQNHKSNYSLASLAVRQNDPPTGLFYYKQALLKNPSEHAFVNLANIYNNNSRYFDAVFTLKEGLGLFPESGPIKNNLALLYNRLNIKDSSLVFLKAAMDHKLSKDVASANAMAVYAKAGKANRPDSVDGIFVETDYLPVLTNRLIIMNQEGLGSIKDFDASVFKDSVLNLNTYSYLNNYTFNTLFDRDTTLSGIITQLQFHGYNTSFQENLRFLKAVHAYYHNDVAGAFNIMESLQGTSQEAMGYYNYILGIWAMEQQAPLLAAGYFSKAESRHIEGAIVLKGVALAMAENPDQAREHWSSLLYEDDEDMVSIASNMLKVINLDRDLTLTEENETFVYRGLLFNFSQLNDAELQDLVNQLHNPQLKFKFYKIALNHFITQRETGKASSYLEALISLQPANKTLENEIKWMEAQLMAIDKNVSQLKEIYKELKPSTGKEENLHQYFQAIIYESEGKNAEAAKQYHIVGHKNPFMVNVVVDASQYFRNNMDGVTAYNILRNAIDINRTSKELHKQYIFSAIEIGLNEYAESALLDYKNLAAKDEYKKFYEKYNTKLNELKQKNIGWD
ncbi:MAG: hypothetical protein M3512_02720 [Bacteroidota bacterium]|nr:hypothetical protein [Bacteroidota bacterium]